MFHTMHTLEKFMEGYEGKKISHLFLPGFLASSSLNFPTALPLNPPPPLLPSPSSIFVPNLPLSARLGWLELPLPPRMSENLLDLFPPAFVLVVTIVVCIAKAGIENLFFLLIVSSLRFGEETFHLTFGGGLNSGLVGSSNIFSGGSVLSGENSPDVEIEVDRYPLAIAVVKLLIPLFTLILEGSGLLVWPGVKPESGGLPSLKSSRIWR